MKKLSNFKQMAAITETTLFNYLYSPNEVSIDKINRIYSLGNLGL